MLVERMFVRPLRTPGRWHGGGGRLSQMLVERMFAPRSVVSGRRQEPRP